MAVAFAAAWALGLLAQKLRLSPIVGYLVAGVLIGPRTPGLVADVALAGQLAEMGVVLLMFGVGLHFQPKDLSAVKGVAIPGALLQSAAATGLGTLLGLAFGWPVASGLVLGLALSVASTVVLLRALESRDLTATPAGHVAIGWLVVEDVLTVVVLVVIPALGTTASAASAGAGAAAGVSAVAASGGLAVTLSIALAKLAALVALVAVVGSRVVPWVLVHVARLQSRELFTLTVLTVALAIAVGSAVLFGVSMALGAFLAGMVVGQSPVSQQAAADALPLRDAFAVLFFVSVGMLFEPMFVIQHPALLAGALAIVLVGKPLAALLVVAALGYSTRTALVTALGLAQVGEFSFILGDLAHRHGLLSETGQMLLVACALVSISLNPVLFRGLDGMEARLRRYPRLWRLLNARAARRQGAVNAGSAAAVAAHDGPLAVVVGYGPVGQAADRALRSFGLTTVIVDLNVDQVAEITGQGRLALYGDASRRDILEQAGLTRASHLVVTLPHSLNRTPLVTAARQLNPRCRILVRARYLRERAELEQAGADEASYEELEAAVALTSQVMTDLGGDQATIARETARIRRETAAP
jgi:CPA2 family monovalent cation:H+ antiporter-2